MPPRRMRRLPGSVPLKTTRDPSVEQPIWDEINRQLDASGATIAAEMGPAPEHSKLDPNTELKMWNFELTPEMVARAAEDESLAKIVNLVGPRLQQLQEAGAHQEAAVLARWPFRELLYTSGRPRIEDQIKYAEQMAKKSGHWPPPNGEIMPNPMAQPPDGSPAPSPTAAAVPGPGDAAGAPALAPPDQVTPAPAAPPGQGGQL
jgi:hypothetical protein